jgi:hypothetical protein
MLRHVEHGQRTENPISLLFPLIPLLLFSLMVVTELMARPLSKSGMIE